MYTSFEALHKAYGFEDGHRTRDNLSHEEEQAFVKDCFDTYEHIGFSETLHSPYPEMKRFNGMKFEVVGRVKELADDANGADLESLPMWVIKLVVGGTFNAYPEEICIAERKE